MQRLLYVKTEITLLPTCYFHSLDMIEQRELNCVKLQKICLEHRYDIKVNYYKRNVIVLFTL